MKKEQGLIYGIPAMRLGEVIGNLFAAGINPQGLTNFLWLLKNRQKLEILFRMWERKN